MKKVISLVLVMAMILSSMSFAFGTTNFEDVTSDNDYAEAINTLVALGVINGYDDGTFKPEQTITRAEMAKLMVITLGYGDLVSGSVSSFSDTQGHWADSYIALAAGKGIVIGDGNGEFRPDATVSYNEVYTMLVRGLGYTDTCNELKNMTWPTNFKVKAADLGITDDVKMSSTEADRGGVAQAIFNALEAILVTIDTDGDVVYYADSDDDSILLFSRLADLDEDYEVTESTLDSDNSNYGGDLIDLAPYMFQNLDVYTNDDDDVVYIKDTNSLVYEGAPDDIDDDGEELTIELLSGSYKDIDFEDTEIAAEDLFKNGAMADDDMTLEDINDDAETITVVVNDDEDLGGDDDGKFDADELAGVVITVRTDITRIENTYTEGKETLDGLQLAVDDDDDVDEDKITVTGDVTSIYDIEEDDIVVSYLADDESAVTLVVTRNTVEGTITKVYDSNTYYIDGVSYDSADDMICDDFDLGDEGTFYLDQNGEIADYDGESSGPTDYAIVFGAEDGVVDSSFGDYDVDTYPELKLATQDGEEIVYEVAVEVDVDDDDDLYVDDAAIISDGADIVGLDDDDYMVEVGTYDSDDDEYVLDVESIFGSDNAYLVKYSLDSDGRIDELEILAEVTDYMDEDSDDLNDVDLDDDDLSDGCIIFDAGDDFAVVDTDDLNTEIVAYAELDDDGDIEVLVVQAGEVDEATDTVYAYIGKVTKTYNDDGDKVNSFIIYTDGEQQEILGTDDDLDVDGYYTAMSFEYDGTEIDSDTVDTTVTGYVVTATSITSSKMKLEFVDDTYSDGWYSVSDHITVLELDEDDDVSDVQSLSDIDDDDVVTVYINEDGEIDLVIYYED
jgi:hypothetical protein